MCKRASGRLLKKTKVAGTTGDDSRRCVTSSRKLAGQFALRAVNRLERVHSQSFMLRRT